LPNTTGHVLKFHIAVLHGQFDSLEGALSGTDLILIPIPNKLDLLYPEQLPLRALRDYRSHKHHHDYHTDNSFHSEVSFLFLSVHDLPGPIRLEAGRAEAVLAFAT
jgi:hypothetical protein